VEVAIRKTREDDPTQSQDSKKGTMTTEKDGARKEKKVLVKRHQELNVPTTLIASNAVLSTYPSQMLLYPLSCSCPTSYHYQLIINQGRTGQREMYKKERGEPRRAEGERAGESSLP
jgi:hypothetical protein